MILYAISGLLAAGAAAVKTLWHARRGDLLVAAIGIALLFITVNCVVNEPEEVHKRLPEITPRMMALPAVVFITSLIGLCLYAGWKAVRQREYVVAAIIGLLAVLLAGDLHNALAL